ncbi:unnamed protein product [Urochloa decumbens]|uniref:KIB1-4 beta-propeller domain-containing protein n=1 Tax=Urochloa decumbens TaxID=240449 RepID=A0ABC9G6J5_9POAL
MEAPAPAPEERDWTSLHQDITRLITERLLEEDVTEYIAFRGVCTHWRSSTPSPRDPTLADRRFHPRGWVALCEGTGVRPVDDEAITFFHTSSGKVRRLRLRELRGQRIVGFTDGLILLLDTATAAVRVLHPFTRVVPQLIAVVICFPNMPVVICAEPSRKDWRIIHSLIQFTNTLTFNGRLYGVTRVKRQLVQVYPLNKRVVPVVAEVPKELGCPRSCRYYLVESMGAMLVAVLHKISSEKFNAFTLFKVDLSRHELTRVPSLGDRALFLSYDRCLSVSTMNQPSISNNCIHFAMPMARYPVTVHSLSDGSFESLSVPCLDDKPAVGDWTSVQPYTLADHLLTYCHHREWSRGIMFNELHSICSCWNKLSKKTTEQDSEVVVPRLRLTPEQLKKLEIPNLFTFMTSVATIRGNRSRIIE